MFYLKWGGVVNEIWVSVSGGDVSVATLGTFAHAPISIPKLKTFRMQSTYSLLFLGVVFKLILCAHC